MQWHQCYGTGYSHDDFGPTSWIKCTCVHVVAATLWQTITMITTTAPMVMVMLVTVMLVMGDDDGVDDD